MSELLDINPLSGALEEMQFDHTTGSLVIKRTETNVDAVMDAAAAVRNDGSEAWRGADNTMWHVGTVPDYIWNVWLAEFNAKRFGVDKIRSYLDPNEEWQSFWWGKLASSEYYKFKLTPKRL